MVILTVYNILMSIKNTEFSFVRSKQYGKSVERMADNTSLGVIKSFNFCGRKETKMTNTSKTIRIKTMESSIQKALKSSKSRQFINTPISPKNSKFKWMLYDEGLRQTDDSCRPTNKISKISIRHFKILKTLGKGKHGIVYMAVHKQSGFVGALKVFQKKDFHSSSLQEREKLQELLIRELKIQSYVSHTHILKVYSIFNDQKCVYLFMELGPEGQLFDMFQKKGLLKQQSISFIFRTLLEAVKYLHNNHIIHRDLKPQNIVLIHGFPKICDFGQSNICSKEKGQLRQTLCGTPLYLSPEILKGEKYDQKIDIWALGAMAYQLFTGSNPFNVKTKQELKKVVISQFQMKIGSLQFRNFLTYCLKKSAKERPSADKLLKHPFITKWAQLQTSQQLCRE